MSRRLHDAEDTLSATLLPVDRPAAISRAGSAGLDRSGGGARRRRCAGHRSRWRCRRRLVSFVDGDACGRQRPRDCGDRWRAGVRGRDSGDRALSSPRLSANGRLRDWRRVETDLPARRYRPRCRIESLFGAGRRLGGTRRRTAAWCARGPQGQLECLGWQQSREKARRADKPFN